MSSFLDQTVKNSTDEFSIDVNNMDNSVARWKNALDYYRQNCASIRSSRTSEKIRCAAIIDTSYSMEGKRLICVKLGLCSILANFEENDEMNVICFSSKIASVTEGFKAVSQLLVTAPLLLHEMNSNGCTAFYDAIVDGIGSMRDRSNMYKCFATSSPDEKFKNVSIVLTDGEDNESVNNARSIERILLRPCINNFMFLLVAVDMTRTWERKFRRWMDLNYCKQVRVNVKTGSSLVGVFKEMLLCRILQTESSSIRFLHDNTSSTESSGCELLDIEYDKLREKFSRTTTNPQCKGDIEFDEDCDEDDWNDVPHHIDRCGSEGVSSVYSASDGGDCRDDNSDDEWDSLCDIDDKEDSSIISCTDDDTDDGDDEEPQDKTYSSECYCPISHVIMSDPVICADGYTYERKNIEKWLAHSSISPVTNLELDNTRLVPNEMLRNLIQLTTNQINTALSKTGEIENRILSISEI